VIFPSALQAYVCRDRVDMRRGVDGLCRDFRAGAEAYRPWQHAEGRSRLAPLSEGHTRKPADSLVLASVLLLQPLEVEISASKTLQEKWHQRRHLRTADASQAVGCPPYLHYLFRHESFLVASTIAWQLSSVEVWSLPSSCDTIISGRSLSLAQTRHMK